MDDEHQDRLAALSIEFQQFGKNYPPDKLADLDWCIKELAALGYSTSIIYVTRAYAKSRFGREPDYPPGVIGLYTYQLWGPRYLERGSHQSPLTDNINEAVMIALFNICRLDALHPISEGSETNH
jgi:hypothetical protein